MVNNDENHGYLVGGWATPLKKYEFVSWDDYSQYMEKYNNNTNQINWRWFE